MHWLWGGESGQGFACWTFFWEPTHTVCTIFHKSFREEKYIFNSLAVTVPSVRSHIWGTGVWILREPSSLRHFPCLFLPQRKCCVTFSCKFKLVLSAYTLKVPVWCTSHLSAATCPGPWKLLSSYIHSRGCCKRSLQREAQFCIVVCRESSLIVATWQENLLQECWKDAMWYNPLGAPTEHRKSFVPELCSLQSVIICEPQRSALKHLLKK